MCMCTRQVHAADCLLDCSCGCCPLTCTHTLPQVEALIYFEDSLEQLVQWDKQVATVCVKVDSILDTLNAAAAAAPAMA